jgi:hypothetical protein
MPRNLEAVIKEIVSIAKKQALENDISIPEMIEELVYEYDERGEFDTYDEDKFVIIEMCKDEADA